MDTDDKNVRDMRLLPIRDRISEKYGEEWGEATVEEIMYKMQKFVVRRWLLDEGKRVDGRGINEIRPLAAEVGLLPRVHGSGIDVYKRQALYHVLKGLGKTVAVTCSDEIPARYDYMEIGLYDGSFEPRYICLLYTSTGDTRAGRFGPAALGCAF